MADSGNSTGGMGSAGGTALGAAVGGIIGMGQGAINSNQNKKAQRRAFNMQKDLNKQGAELALQQWKDTNYLPQVNELKKAGLSTGLMYEGGGAGGQTNAGSGGGAPQQAPAQYDMGMAMQGAERMMQLKLMEAQTEKTNAEAENLRGADRENTTQDTALKAMQTKNQEIVNNVANKTFEEQVAEIKANADKAQSEARSALQTANTDEQTQQARVDQIKNESIASALEAGLKRSNIDVNKAQVIKIAEDIRIGKFNAETARNTIGVDKVAGSLLQNLANEVMNAMGYDKDRGDQKVDDGKK